MLCCKMQNKIQPLDGKVGVCTNLTWNSQAELLGQWNTAVMQRGSLESTHIVELPPPDNTPVAFTAR